MSIERRFLSNLLLVIGINLLIKPLFIFGIDRTVQNTVGATDYGLYFALLNFVYLFQIFNDLGIQNFNHSVYSKFDYLIPKYLPKILGTKLVLAVLFLVIIYTSGFLLGYRGLSVQLLFLLAINQVLASLLIFMRTNLSARGYYWIDSILSVLDKSLMIILVGYLLWFTPRQEFEITHYIFAQTICFTLAVGIAFLLLRFYRIVTVFRIRFDFAYSRWILKKSFPYALVLLLMTLYTRMDGVMIERLLPNGREQAGIYAASYRILDACAMVGLLFAGLLLPMFAKAIASRSNRISGLTQTAGSMIWALSVVVVASCIAFSDPIMYGLYDDANPYYGDVFKWVMASYIAICLSYVYGTLLTANESMVRMNQIFVVGVVLNLILNIVLIWHWQAKGAAVATFVTQSATSLALIYRAHQELKLAFHFKALIRGLVYLGCVIVLTLAVLKLPLIWWQQWILLVMACLPASLITRQIPLDFTLFRDLT